MPAPSSVWFCPDVIRFICRAIQLDEPRVEELGVLLVDASGRMSFRALSAVLDELRQQHPVLAAVHKIALAVQTSCPLKYRVFKEGEEPDGLLGYYADFNVQILRRGLRVPDDNVEEPFLYVGDIWDGRFISAVYSFLADVPPGQGPPDLGRVLGVPEAFCAYFTEDEVVRVQPRRPPLLRASHPPSVPSEEAKEQESKKPPMIESRLSDRIFELWEFTRATYATPATGGDGTSDGAQRLHSLEARGPADLRHFHSTLPLHEDFDVQRRNPPRQGGSHGPHFAEAVASQDGRSKAPQSREAQLAEKPPTAAEVQSLNEYMTKIARALRGVHFVPGQGTQPVARDGNVLAVNHGVIAALLQDRGEELDWANDVIQLTETRKAEIGLRYDPEPWQLHMIDAVDQGRSLLVVAPTSSGKTWAAEYAAFKVLRDHDGDSMVAYVLPTNALVNQTFASLTVLAESNQLDRSAIGCFTRERRTPNFAQSRVLVTNPACLEIVLLGAAASPAERSVYDRLEWLVVDEIHTIGMSSDESSSSEKTLERLITMVPCPLICLSATLANDSDFLRWLRSVKGGRPEHSRGLGERTDR